MKTTKLLLLLLTALLVGVCIGFFTNSAIIRARIRRYSEIRAHRSAHIIGMLTKHLALTEEQQSQIRGIVLTYETRITEAQKQSEALYKAPLEEMADAITPCLTPKQQEAYKQMRSAHRRNHQQSRALMSAFSADTPTDQADQP